MKRSIIKIDEEKCNGCGLCVPSCHEGAIRIVNGKARLAADSLCDGLGACLGECPQGAIRIEEREAATYNEIEALENIMKEGPGAVAGHLKHLAEHGQKQYLREAEEYLKAKEGKVSKDEDTKPMACGCPGSMTRDFRRKDAAQPVDGASAAAGPVASALQQWPVQLRLLNPQAPFFQDADLVVSADCVPFTFADFHRRFLKNKVLVIFCPKLDEDLEEYREKLTEIFRANDIRSVTMVRMEVPCCGGTVSLVEDAVRQSGKSIILKEYTISLRGEII
ncbi:MAG: 4Fe-4S binding protein [Candidatus Omnitrophica bacterium]|nr:4Fe-4S binding protein [Candidatus Omnitrophota bacterium]